MVFEQITERLPAQEANCIMYKEVNHVVSIMMSTLLNVLQRRCGLWYCPCHNIMFPTVGAAETALISGWARRGRAKALRTKPYHLENFLKSYENLYHN